MKVLFPLVGLVVGTGGGVGAALMLSEGDQTAPETDEEAPVEISAPFDLVTLNNQFVVPIVENEKVSAMVILSLGLEVAPGLSGDIYEREAKLRDIFLRVLFRHANIGGFGTEFTALQNIELLRSELLFAAQEEMGDDIQGVLITSLARQDV